MLSMLKHFKVVNERGKGIQNKGGETFTKKYEMLSYNILWKKKRFTESVEKNERIKIQFHLECFDR